MNKSSWLRLPFLGVAILSFTAALWAGWIRMGWQWPTLIATLPGMHGPLMVSAFLGTLIGLERAVALQPRKWVYLAPALSAGGGLAFIIGAKWIGAGLIVLAGLGLVAVFAQIIRLQNTTFTWIMMLGAVCWLVGSFLWLLGEPVFMVVPWWANFLILTIAGERLELGRLIRLSRMRQTLFLVLIGVTLAGLVVLFVHPDLGMRIYSVGLCGLALWLLLNDIARRTVRKPGLPRFAAVSLLSGFVWLGIAGLLGIGLGIQHSGPYYDAYLHAIFLGFVFSMIFGHAPVIFPAILNLPLAFHPRLYFPLGLLHASLILRLSGDFAGIGFLRLWGGLLNGVAILLFLGLFFGGTYLRSSKIS